MAKVVIYVAEGFEEIEAISIIDVLRRAEIEVTAVSITGKYEVKGAHSITLLTDELFENVNHQNFDMVVLPGGMPGTSNLDHHLSLRNEILNFKSNRKYIGAICAAPMILGQLGILENKTVTCYPGFESYLDGANVTGSAVEVSGKIVTGKGPGVAIAFSLKLVELLEGKEMADKVAKGLLV